MCCYMYTYEMWSIVLHAIEEVYIVWCQNDVPSLAVLRFLDWPHVDGEAPEFDEERYEVARYAILKVK